MFQHQQKHNYHTTFACFSLSTVAALPFAGVKVEATGIEKILYFTSFLVVFVESSKVAFSFTLKASEMVGVYGFTTFTTSVLIVSFSRCWA